MSTAAPAPKKITDAELALSAFRIARTPAVTFLPEAAADEQLPADFLVRFCEYEKPADNNDLEQCIEADVHNAEAWKTNRLLTDALNTFLRKANVNGPPQKAPTSYVKNLQNLLKTKLRDPTFATLAAIEYLHCQLFWTPYESYEPSEAVSLANNYAANEYIERQRETGGVRLPELHVWMCGCNNNEWNGSSPQCTNKWFNLRWVASEVHSFLFPHVVIEAIRAGDP